MKINQDLKEALFGVVAVGVMVWISLWFCAGLVVALMELTK